MSRPLSLPAKGVFPGRRGIRAEHLATQERLRREIRFAKSLIISLVFESGTLPVSCPRVVRECRYTCRPLALASKPGISPESDVSPIITARQSMVFGK